MAQPINIPGVGTINFPDGMAQGDIESAIQKNFPQIHPAPEGGSRLLGGLEGSFNSLGQAASAIPTGLAGIAGLIKGGLTPGETAGNTAQDYMQATQEFMNKPRITIGTPENQQAQRYQEGNAAAQQGISSVMNALPTVVEKSLDLANRGAAKVLPNSMMGPLSQINAAVQGIGNVGSNLLMGKALSKIPGLLPEAAAPQAAALTPKQQMLQLAQQKYGLKIAPGEAGGAPIASALEDVTGAAMAEKLATAKNQPMVNKVGAQEIQQPTMTSFTKENLESAKKPPTANYNQVGNVGTVPTDDTYRSDFTNLNLNPHSKGTIPNAKNEQIDDLQNRFINLKSFDAQDALNEIGDLRSTGWKNIKAPNAPEQNRLGGAQVRAATALEDQLDRYISSRPEGFDDPGMIQRWKDARTLLAKIHTVEAAKVGTDLSVTKLRKAYENGAPLTGGLLDIAKIGEQFPNSLKDASRIRGPRTFTKLGATVGAGGGLTALALGHPAIAGVIGAGMVGTPMLRSALLSKPVQASLLPKIPGQIDPMLMRLLMGGAPAALNANQNPLLGNQ